MEYKIETFIEAREIHKYQEAWAVNGEWFKGDSKSILHSIYD